MIPELSTLGPESLHQRVVSLDSSETLSESDPVDRFVPFWVLKNAVPVCQSTSVLAIEKVVHEEREWGWIGSLLEGLDQSPRDLI